MILSGETNKLSVHQSLKKSGMWLNDITGGVSVLLTKEVHNTGVVGYLTHAWVSYTCQPTCIMHESPTCGLKTWIICISRAWLTILDFLFINY